MPASSTGGTAAAAPRLPDRIGNYRILGRLGEGGMGVVFEAEQQSPRRRVALKVIRDGGFADELSRRLFAREIATLARLRHAQIAQIYESGITDDGHPFFTMELLHGVTLGQHVRGRSATPDAAEIRARVRLFGMVCDAISHAHQRGVIHRDLKPANIVVLQDSATASAFARETNLQVKVLDFGLARLEQDDPTATSIAGAAGSVRGTLPYMSPEQVRGEPLDVRTDVYSLGVILYELIAGRRPYEVPSASLLTAARVICETPPRPLREGWPGRGKPDADLETILRKALEKDCDRRYGSVAALAEDLERWLAKQPILARPPSAAYQMRKFIARHRVPVALGSALLVSLLGFGIGMSVLYARSLRAEKKAVAEAETARRVGDYLVGLFRQSDPREKRGVEMTTEELLSRGAARVDRELADRPDLRAQVLNVLADVHLGAGLPARAESLALVALTAADYLGADSEEKLEAQSLLMHCAIATGRLEDAQRLGLDLVERARRIHGPEHERTLLGELNLGMIQWDLGRMEEAFPRLDRVNAWVRGRGGARTPFELEALQAYAAGLFGMGRVDESASVMGAVVVDARRLLDPNDHRLSGFLKNYGITLQSLGRPSEGAGPLREAYGIDTAIYPRAHLTRADSGVHFAWVLNELGRAAEAETVGREAVACLQAIKPEYWRTGMARVILGESLARQGRLDEAEPHILQGWAILESDAGSLPPFRRAMLARVAWFHGLRGRAEDAERIRAQYRREYGADPPALPAL